MLGKRSIVALIDRSNLFSQVFADYVQKDNGPEGHEAGIDRVKNMHLAKHRFDSLSKPLGRLVRHIGPAIATALHIVNDRKTKVEGIAAAEWLSDLNEEKYLQAAMMADATDEALLLVRICDTEVVDTADIPSEVSGFVARARFLFGPRGGCREVAGYTKYALAVLQHVRRWHVGGASRSFGGNVRETVFRRALGRMTSWLATVESVVAAEFPCFDVLQSFEVFSLTGVTTVPMVPSATADDLHFQRLAKTFQVDACRLAAQYCCFRQLALDRMRTGGVSSGAAWQQAVLQTQRRREQRERYPCDALMPVLVAQRTFVASTSGVEQGFARALQAVSPQQRCLTASHERDLVKVVVDRQAVEEIEVLANAQTVWRHLHGKPRNSPVQPRCDKGIRRPRAPTASTEAGFLRLRRAAVAKAVAAVGPGGLDGHDGSQCGLTDKQHHEIDFQHKKFLARKIEAYDIGLLVPTEVTDDFKLAADQHLAKRQKTDAVATRERFRRKMLQHGGRVLPDDWLHGKRAHIGETVVMDEGVLLAKGMVMSIDVTDSDCFIVSDPTPKKLPVETRWAACLLGGYVVVPQVLTGSPGGAAVKFKAALLTKRDIWISPAFAAKHTDINTVILACVDHFAGCKWKLVAAANAADYASVVAQAAVSRRSRFIGLVVKTEVRALPACLICDPLACQCLLSSACRVPRA